MNVLILHANAGQGHKKVAETIARQMARDKSDWQVEVHDALDFTPGFFKAAYPAVYYYSVKYTPAMWGWSYDFAETKLGIAVIYPLRKFGNRFVARKLLNKVIAEKPDVVICTHFLSAQLLSLAKQQGLISSKIIVVITDFVPHEFWVNKGTDLYWVMSEEGRDNLLARGVNSECINVGGIPIDNAFLPQPDKRQSLVKKFNLEENRMTLMISSGSFGLGPTEELLDQLTEFSDKVQALVICGNNAGLKKKLDSKSYAFPVHAFGFIDYMADVMEASDLLIAKCGGSTTCESLAKTLPMVVLKPIPGQEAGNASILKARGAAFSIEEPREIKVILKNIFDHKDLLPNKKKEIRTLSKPHAVNDLIEYIEINHKNI